jgi:hypothetical protein
MLSETLVGQENIFDGMRGGISPTLVPESLVLPMKNVAAQLDGRVVLKTIIQWLHEVVALFETQRAWGRICCL